MRGWALIAAGRGAKELAPDTPLVRTLLASALARAGRTSEALAEIRAIEGSPGPLPAVWLAPAWLALGQPDRAAALREQARQQGAPQYVYTFYEPRFANLRGARTAAKPVSGAPGGRLPQRGG